MTPQQPILPMSVTERFGCLFCLCVAALMWLLPLYGCYRWGQNHPRNVVNVRESVLLPCEAWAEPTPLPGTEMVQR